MHESVYDEFVAKFVEITKVRLSSELVVLG